LSSSKEATVAGVSKLRKNSKKIQRSYEGSEVQMIQEAKNFDHYPVSNGKSIAI
jgi:hypothetical protein